jgi:hypothetical protein
MYIPTVGRWLNEDPEGLAAGDTNLLRYVGNDPTNATDPSGLLTQPYGPNGKPAQNPFEGDGVTTINIPFADGSAQIAYGLESWQQADARNIRDQLASFSITLNGKPPSKKQTDLLLNTHWIQFFQANRYDAMGRPANSGTFDRWVYDTDKKDGKLTKIGVNWGDWALDTNALNCTWMTDNQLSTSTRTLTQLKFWDSPDFEGLTSKQYPTVTVNFQTFLVVDKQDGKGGIAVYQVNWSATWKFKGTKKGKDGSDISVADRSYSTMSGSVPTKLPDYLTKTDLYISSRWLWRPRTLNNPVKGVGDAKTP